MRFAYGFSLLLVLAVGLTQVGGGNTRVALAQTPDVNQSVLAELKGIHATLGRLVEMTEALEKDQRAALAVQQVQVYDNRMKTLQAQRSQLAAREADLNRTVTALAASLGASDTVMGPNGLPVPETSDTSHRAAMSEQLATATGTLQAVREKQQSLEQEIAAVQDRISRLDKLVDDRVKR